MTTPLDPAELKTAALAAKENLSALRRDFHRHPELAGQEEKTARRVVTERENLGLAVETGIAGMDPVAAAVLSIGRMIGGSQRNVLSDRVMLEGTARAADPAIAAQFPALIRDVAEGVAAGFGASAGLLYYPGYPPLVNAPSVNAHVRKAAADLGASYPVLEIPTPLLAGEDFAYFARAVPGAMFLLGVGNPDMEAVYPLYQPQFRIDEEALPVGVATMACAIASFCAGNDWR